MKKFWIAIVAIALLAAGWFGYNRFIRPARASTETSYQTVAAGRGDLTATVGATGIVRANQTAVLTWQTTGTVEGVNVAVGDPVNADQVLATLLQTSLPQAVIQAQAELVNAQKALDDLRNSRLQTAQALQAVEDAEQALEDARNPELARARAQEAIAVAQQAVERAENALRWAQSPAGQVYIDEAEAQVTLARDRLNKAREKFAPYANKPESDVTRARLQSELAAAQQQYDAAVMRLNSLRGTAGETEVQLREADLATAQAQLWEAQREWDRVKDGPSEVSISLLEAQLEDARRHYERVKDGGDPDDIAAAEARVAAAQATLDQARLTAPFEGTATQVLSKPGDQVSPGTAAFRIDDLSHLLLDVQISEVDVNRVSVGQEVALTFDAILGKEYHGEVTQVALVGSTTQGVVDFTVTVELTDPDQAVRPGMTAAVNIVVQQLEDVLLVPNRAVRLRDGKRVVYILQNGVAEPVQITLGASSESMSEVVDGDLKAGDQIVLNPPTIFEGRGGPPF